MADQNYSNHTRYYAAHHFVFYPLIAIVAGFCVARGIKEPGLSLIWFVLSFISVLIGWLSFMLRQHYALTLQNRIVIGELRYRYFILTGQRFEDVELLLSQSQLFALRFAGDEELPLLTARAVKEKMTADAIKKSIKSWKADNRRV